MFRRGRCVSPFVAVSHAQSVYVRFDISFD